MRHTASNDRQPLIRKQNTLYTSQFMFFSVLFYILRIAMQPEVFLLVNNNNLTMKETETAKK
jgi:hypothetical protein